MRAAGAITGLMVLGTFMIPGTYLPKNQAASYPIGASPLNGATYPAVEVGSALVAGTVFGPDGTPLRGAEVSLSGSGFWPPRAVRTGANGHFHWPGVPAGVYELRASYGNLVAPPVEGLILDPGARRVFGFRLAEGWTVSGVVVDAESGAPISGAQVHIATGLLGAYSRDTETNGRGRFAIQGVVGDPQNVYVEADGYLPIGPLFVSEAEPDLEARVERGASLAGVVVDDRGLPVEDAIVGAYGGDGAFVVPATLNSLGVTAGPVPPISAVGTRQLAFAEQLTTDGAGEFRFRQLRPGTYTVIATHDDFAPAESESVRLRSGGARSNVRVVLRPGAELRGRVLDALGRGLVGIPVELRVADDQLPRMAVSSEDGSFSFAGVRGDVTVTALPYDLQPASQQVSMDDGPREIDLTLSSALLTLRGRVVDERGEGVEGAMVTAISKTAGATIQRSGKSQIDGTFSVPALPDPPYDLNVEHPGFSAAQLSQVEAIDDVEVTLVEGVTLHGRVIDHWSEKPIAGAIVDLEGPAKLSARTARDGWFVFRRAPIGTYEIRFGHPDFESQVQRIEVEPLLYADRPQELSVVRLAPGGTIEGEVRGAYGEPVVDAEVTWGYPVAWDASVSTDGRGKFRLRGVPAGSVWLVARHRQLGEGVSSEPVTVRPTETSPGAYVRLEGRVDLNEQADLP